MPQRESVATKKSLPTSAALSPFPSRRLVGIATLGEIFERPLDVLAKHRRISRITRGIRRPIRDWRGNKCSEIASIARKRRHSPFFGRRRRAVIGRVAIAGVHFAFYEATNS